MSASRKGLKREGFRRYVVEGSRAIAIDREPEQRRFYVRPMSFPRVAGFFALEFRRLRDARKYAEQETGIA